MRTDILKTLSVSAGRLGQKRIIVSGAEGYIGSRLVSGFTDIISGCLAEIPVQGNEVFIHLAAAVADNSLKSLLDNMALDSAVADYCQKHQLKLIYASGNNVYPMQENCTEETPYEDSDYYSLSKIIGEQLVSASRNNFGFALFRIGDVFGFRQRHGNFFKALQNAIAENKPLSLYGKGSKKRNYIYIQELVAVFRYFINHPEFINGEAYNICFDKAYTIREIIEKISEETGLEIKKVDYAEKDDVRTMNNTKLKNTGYKFLYNMDSGLKDYVKQIKS